MSRRSIWTALGAALLLAGQVACVHTHTVESGDSTKASGGGGDAAAQPKESEGGATGAAHLARKPQEPGRPGLAAAPGGLFVPGGVETLQKKLADKGYLKLDDIEAGKLDVETSGAIRKFQSDSDLARTGNPDHETVRRLGLDPDKLFRKSEDVKKDKD